MYRAVHKKWSNYLYVYIKRLDESMMRELQKVPQLSWKLRSIQDINVFTEIITETCDRLTNNWTPMQLLLDWLNDILITIWTNSKLMRV